MKKKSTYLKNRNLTYNHRYRNTNIMTLLPLYIPIEIEYTPGPSPAILSEILHFEKHLLIFFVRGNLKLINLLNSYDVKFKRLSKI